jgi:hypothetical protein
LSPPEISSAAKIKDFPFAEETLRQEDKKDKRELN